MQVECPSCKASDQSSKVQVSQKPETEFDTGLSARVTGSCIIILTVTVAALLARVKISSERQEVIFKSSLNILFNLTLDLLSIQIFSPSFTQQK